MDRRRGKLHQHLVADQVPEGVVDQLEVVDVGDDQRDRVAEAAEAVHLAGRGFFETPAGQQAGERIGGGTGFHLGQGLAEEVLAVVVVGEVDEAQQQVAGMALDLGADVVEMAVHAVHVGFDVFLAALRQPVGPVSAQHVEGFGIPVNVGPPFLESAGGFAEAGREGTIDLGEAAIRFVYQGQGDRQLVEDLGAIEGGGKGVGALRHGFGVRFRFDSSSPRGASRAAPGR